MIILQMTAKAALVERRTEVEHNSENDKDAFVNHLHGNNEATKASDK